MPMEDVCFPLRVIVAGYERGGTTLMAEFLKRHPLMEGGFEGGLLLGATPGDFLGIQPYAKNFVRGWNLTDEDLRYICGASTWAGAYERVRERSPLFQGPGGGKLGVLDKTPRYMAALGDVLEKVPTVPCIVVVRDPRAVLWSWAKRFEGSVNDWIKRNLNGACERYVNYARGWRRARDSDRGNRVMTVKYEEFCTHADDLGPRIYDFAGLEYDPRYLNIAARSNNVYGSSIDTSFLYEYRDGFSDTVCDQILEYTKEFGELVWEAESVASLDAVVGSDVGRGTDAGSRQASVNAGLSRQDDSVKVLPNVKVVGSVDRIEGGRLTGWASLRADSGTRVEVEIYIDGVAAWSGVADRMRPDLKAAGFGDGRHGFIAELDAELFTDEERLVTVRDKASGRVVEGAQKRLLFTRDPFASPPGSSLSTNSKFGGLWTECANATRLVEGKRKLGWIDEQERDQLVQWLQDGFVVIRNAVDSSAVDKLLAVLEQAWSAQTPEVSLTDYRQAPVGLGHLVGPEDFADSGVMTDVHMRFDTAHDVIFSEKLLRFLELVFERPALAYHSYAAQKAVRQPSHQDSVFFSVNSPMERVGACIALEDWGRDAAGIDCYPGTHKLDEFLFQGKCKWVSDNTSNNELQAYFRHLEEALARNMLTRKTLVLEKGDVIVWSADCAYGVGRMNDADAMQRLVMAQYCPVNVQPLYAFQGPSTGVLPCLGGRAYCIGRGPNSL